MFKPIVLALALAALPLQASELGSEEMLALVAMPLAVAAVSEVADVPMSDLVDIITLLNDADVPPVQFVEVVRYAPVALVVDTEPGFDDVLRAQIAQGVLGTALMPVIEEHFVSVGLRDVDLGARRVVTVVDERFIPAVVTTRLAEVKAHPHGGPPGQLKKAVGVQTGAEIVHGRHPGRGKDRAVTQRGKPREVKVHGGGKGQGKAKGKGKG